jgi:hypothetical protein
VKKLGLIRKSAYVIYELPQSNNGNFGGRVNPNQERVSVKKKPQIQTASTPMPILTKTFRNPTNRPMMYSTTRKSTSR